MNQCLPRFVVSCRQHYLLKTNTASTILKRQPIKTQNTLPLDLIIQRRTFSHNNTIPTLSCIWLKQSIKHTPNILECSNIMHPYSLLYPSCFHTCSVFEHARQMTMIRKRKLALKNKKLKEERLRKNPPPLPYKVQLMLAAKGFGGPPKPAREKDDKIFVADDVYFLEECAWKRWTLEEAVTELRLNNHPSLGYSQPDGLVVAKVEFDLRASKSNKYLDPFSKMVPIIHPYDRGVPDRSVLAFVPNPDMEKEAIEAGALKAGGEELIKEVAKGRLDISDIDHFVAHEDLAGSVNILAGMLRDKLPRSKGNICMIYGERNRNPGDPFTCSGPKYTDNLQWFVYRLQNICYVSIDGTIGNDIPLLIATFTRGMHVSVHKIRASLGTTEEPDYGFCEASIGRLDMDITKIEGNLTTLLMKLSEDRPKRKDKEDNAFITRCILKVSRRGILFKIRRDGYVP